MMKKVYNYQNTMYRTLSENKNDSITVNAENGITVIHYQPKIFPSRGIFFCLLVFLLILFFTGCKTATQITQTEPETVVAKNIPDHNLGNMVNSPQALSGQTGVSFEKYSLLQKAGHQYKEMAPFIEYLDSGKKERLWFTSSKYDQAYTYYPNSNYYFQLYYSERAINTGKLLNEGWGAPVKFEIKSNNPVFENYYSLFNKARKGAVAIANNKMIVACEPFTNIQLPSDREYKDLWSLDRFESEFTNPVRLNTLSSGKTWESQPTLSANGEHLFFVSNRKLFDDGSFSTDETDSVLNIYYSYFNGEEWQTPKAVNEINNEYNSCTPHIGPDNTLCFSSDKTGNFDIYEVPVEFNENGGYQIYASAIKPFSKILINVHQSEENIVVNDSNNQKFPFYYANKANTLTPQAFIWSDNNPQISYGGYDLFGANMPFVAKYTVQLIDKCPQGEQNIIEPVIELVGKNGETVYASTASFELYAGLKYKVKGGSDASVYDCETDSSYIFTGYNRIENETNPSDKESHQNPIIGAEVLSQLSEKFNSLPIHKLTGDTIMYDTVYITKAWERKKPCPRILDIPPKHRSIAYFQTGYWEVNTTENLERDLKKLHEGFEVTVTNDLYKPVSDIKRHKSDYKAFTWENPLFPIKKDDGLTYSIANARWIELHPNNLYWGDRPGFRARLAERMEGRRKRIEQYQQYAKKVDENLRILTDTIKYKYFDFLKLHKEHKPKLLVEIFAVSDQREVTRGWYIGDTVEYRASSYLQNEEFVTDHVKIIPPKIDEQNKVITEIKPCSIELNEDGDNGCKLGITAERSEKNTNLSRLRAWFGYKEIYKRLTNSESFRHFLEQGKVALPDNDISYNDADIIIITQGRRHSDIQNPQNPYPAVNNPSNNGYYDYDDIRRVEVRIRLLFPEDKRIIRTYCCDPTITEE
ncbi:MAG: hypothetical protein K9H26_04325 [Prolixibacteraceae bacterium]|nr:hypothetical protein [Prolixibacteraceae bacterium]